MHTWEGNRASEIQHCPGPMSGLIGTDRGWAHIFGGGGSVVLRKALPLSVGACGEKHRGVRAGARHGARTGPQWAECIRRWILGGGGAGKLDNVKVASAPSGSSAHRCLANVSKYILYGHSHGLSARRPGSQ